MFQSRLALKCFSSLYLVSILLQVLPQITLILTENFPPSFIHFMCFRHRTLSSRNMQLSIHPAPAIHALYIMHIYFNAVWPSACHKWSLLSKQNSQRKGVRMWAGTAEFRWKTLLGAISLLGKPDTQQQQPKNGSTHIHTKQVHINTMNNNTKGTSLSSHANTVCLKSICSLFRPLDRLSATATKEDTLQDDTMGRK